jgi:Tfp pilus assembly protein PilF
MKMNDHDLLLLRHLQAAATFNNIGTTQLKRGVFEGAIDNFKAALYIMNNLSGPNSNKTFIATEKWRQSFIAPCTN